LDDGKAIYGEAPVKKALEMAAVETLLFSEGIERVHGRIKCSNCNKEFLESSTEADFPALESKVSRFACPKCKQESLSVTSKEYLIDEFERKTIETGATLEVISTGHEDGMILLKTFTGLAAILRFPANW
jgi:peptide chain release factor subunit 1